MGKRPFGDNFSQYTRTAFFEEKLAIYYPQSLIAVFSIYSKKDYSLLIQIVPRSRCLHLLSSVDVLQMLGLVIALEWVHELMKSYRFIGFLKKNFLIHRKN